MTLQEYVRSHTATLLRRLAFEVRQTAVRADEDAVHDLRVSIRRLRGCLRTFKQFYPKGPRKKISKDLRALMKFAENVRSADIALELLKKAGLGANEPLVQEIRAARDRHRTALHDELLSLRKRSYSRTWRESLGL